MIRACLRGLTVAVIGAAVGSGAFAQDADAKSKGSNEPTVKNGAAVKEKAEGPNFKGLKMLSVGKPSYGLRIPSFEGDRLDSITDVEVLTKLDENLLRIEGMVFQQVRADDEEGMSVTIEQGIYALKTNTLTSDHDTVVRGQGFIMTGEGCVYIQGQGGVKLIGRVDSHFSSDMNALEDPKPAEDAAGDAADAGSQEDALATDGDHPQSEDSTNTDKP